MLRPNLAGLNGCRDRLALDDAPLGVEAANGSLYHGLHGREDGRSRTFIVRMLFLVVLAVDAGHAAGTDG